MRSLPGTGLSIAAMVLAIAAASSPAFGGSGAEEGASATKNVSVSVRDDRFSPRSRSAARGDKVIWRWRGSNPHNVRFRSVPSGASKGGSGTKSSGRFSRTFRKSGTYRYVCTIHEDIGMRGSVSVE